MGADSPRVLVLDAGALIQLDRGDSRTRGLLRRADAVRAALVIPAGALGQAWRNGSKQVRLATLLKAPDTAITPLTKPMAKAAGELCARAGTNDVVDASVVLVARMNQAIVITTDADDLRRLDPGVDVVAV